MSKVTASEKGRRKALTAEARRKRRRTWAQYRTEEREAVRLLRERGLVPLAIGPALNMPDRTVARYLRDLERDGAIAPVPAYLTRAAD